MNKKAIYAILLSATLFFMGNTSVYAAPKPHDVNAGAVGSDMNIGQAGATYTTDAGIFDSLYDTGYLFISPDYDNFYIYGDGITGEQYYAFKNYIDLIKERDPAVFNSFRAEGWKYVLTNADLNQLMFNGATRNVVGITVFEEKVIYCNINYLPSVLHEMGHYVDGKTGLTSSQPGFGQIYIEEAAKLSMYSTVAPVEFFAEVYEYSFTEPEKCKVNCPQAYYYVTYCTNLIAMNSFAA